jgi:hypothetical protein
MAMHKQADKRALTITFGTVAENGPGMQHVYAAGAKPPAAGDGLTVDDLKAIETECNARGMRTELVALRTALATDASLHDAAEPACVLVVWNLADGLLGGKPASELFSELTRGEIQWDGMALMRGRVKNKRARHNLCFSDVAQQADYAAGKGTVVPYGAVPLLSTARATLGELHPKLKGLPAEGNDYYDFENCGIGFHGDGERPLTVGLRLYGGDKVRMPLHFQWYQNGGPVGHRVAINLPHGAGYFMSEKATGFDWKKRANNRLTLRHATAGLHPRRKNQFLRLGEIQGEVIEIKE